MHLSASALTMIDAHVTANKLLQKSVLRNKKLLDGFDFEELHGTASFFNRGLDGCKYFWISACTDMNHIQPKNQKPPNRRTPRNHPARLNRAGRYIESLKNINIFFIQDIRCDDILYIDMVYVTL